MTISIGSGEAGFVWISANLSHIKPDESQEFLLSREGLVAFNA